MKSIITKSDSSDSSHPVAETAVYLSDDWFGEEKRRSLANGPRRPDQAWPATTAVPHRGRGGGIREGN
jgi:hypothetical protein